MKIKKPLSYFFKFGLTSIVGFLFFGFHASARKIYMTKGSDNGIYVNALSSANRFDYSPGDTFVLRANGLYTYFSLEEFHGAAGKPIVIINEGGQAQVTAMGFRHCTYMKITGTGSSDQYGFYLTIANPTYSPAVAVSGRSSDIEVDHLDIYQHGYGFWIKEEGSCDVSLQYPNWRMNNISVHDCRIRNLLQEGIYAGSTAPNGERSVTCNGVSTNPLPIRLGNVRIYNNIIDHTGRGGIQLSAADYGTNEIYNNTVTNAGFEFDPNQGNGIILGSYTTAYVHDNTIDYTFSTGLFSLGAGLVRIENNRIDHSGLLSGRTANGSANIMVDTRLTVPAILTQFYIKNNTLGSNTDGNIRLYNTVPTLSTSNLVCGNVTTSGAAVVTYANPGITYGTCVGNQLPTANAGPDQTIGTNSVTLTGTGTDTDGSIAAYQWSEVSGPNNATLSNGNSAQAIFSNLVQGTYTFKLMVTDNGGLTASDNLLVTVSPGSSSSGSTVPSTSAGTIRIEAENYSNMYGIQKENTSDAGGGQNIAWQDDNDWMDYSVNVATAGTFALNFRVASMFTGAQFQLRNSSGAVLTTVTVPNTGSFQTWQTVTANVTLPAGTQTLRIYTNNAAGGWNINWWEIAAGSSSTTPSTPTSSTIHIEAENFSSQNGVQAETTSDAGGGQNIGWQDTGDWMDYSVNISAAGTYAVAFRVSSMFTGAQFQLRNSSGAVLTTVTVPNTGSFQTWQTVTANVTLPAGTQTLRIYTNNAAGGWNINWWEIAAGSSTTPSTPTSSTIHIEAENFSSQNGVQAETTSDAGGGQNIGWQDTGDWMDYSVNISAAGTYALNFRVASMFTGAQFQLRNSSGTVLTTVTVPNTGSFQTWQTVTANVTLPAGTQTLRIYTSKAAGGWNINWWEIMAAGSASITTKATDQLSVLSDSTASQLSIFPNPITDHFSLSVNNELTGKVNVSLVNTAGQVIKQFTLTKAAKGATQWYLTIGSIPQGTYILNTTIQNWTKSTKVIKE